MHREMMFASIVMAMVCFSIPIVPSSAQFPGAGVCWNDINNCVAKNLNSTDPEMDQNSLFFNKTEFLCCPLMQQTFDTDLSCFCTATTFLHSPDGVNVTLALSSTCKIYDSLDSLDATCADLTPDVPDTTETPADAASPGPTPSSDDEDIGPCWDTIANCWEKNSNEISTNPEFDVNSPSYDMSKYFCCPLIQQTADTDKPCFCNATTLLHQHSKDAVTTILIKCNVIQSVASFDMTCSENTGSQPKTKGRRFTAAANGMVLPESLSLYSAIFVVLAYFFY